MVRQTSQRTWRYTYSASFYSHLSIPPTINPPLLFSFDTWGGFNLSRCWGLAQEIVRGLLKALFGIHHPWEYLYVCLDVYISYDTISPDWGRASASDKGCWLSLADPRGPFASCQSHGPQRGAPFHPHCPSQGSPSRMLDRGEEKGAYQSWKLAEAFLENNTEIYEKQRLSTHGMLMKTSQRHRYVSDMFSQRSNSCPRKSLLTLSINRVNLMKRCLSNTHIRWDMEEICYTLDM